MRTIFTKLSVLLSAMICMVLVACNEGPYYGNARLGSRDHSDAVVNINQVDPEYRKYFADQHDSNFSLQDQRKAYFEAVKTSNTPVQQDARHVSANNAPKKTNTKKSKSQSSRKKVVKKKAPAKSKSATKKSTAKKSKSGKKR